MGSQPHVSLRRYRLAVGFRLATILALVVSFLVAPLLEFDLQGHIADCYGWRASFRESTESSQRGLNACINFLSAVNTQGTVFVSIKPDVASTGELCALMFMITVLLVCAADLLSLAAISGSRFAAQLAMTNARNVGIKTETWIVFLGDLSGFLRFLGTLVCFIGIQASATLRKEMSNGDAFVAVDAALGPGAYLIGIFTLLSFVVPPAYGGGSQ